MIETLARNWSLVVARGVAIFVFGVLTLLDRTVGVAAYVDRFGVFSILEGAITTAVAATRPPGAARNPVVLAAGLLGIAYGVLILFWPGASAVLLLYLIAGWAALFGIGEVFAAMALRKRIRDEWRLIASGLLSLALAAGLIAASRRGAMGMILWIGSAAVLLGVLRAAFGFRLRRWWTKGASE